MLAVLSSRRAHTYVRNEAIKRQTGLSARVLAGVTCNLNLYTLNMFTDRGYFIDKRGNERSQYFVT